ATLPRDERTRENAHAPDRGSPELSWLSPMAAAHIGRGKHLASFEPAGEGERHKSLRWDFWGSAQSETWDRQCLAGLTRTTGYKKAHTGSRPGPAPGHSEAGGNMFHCLRTECLSCVCQWQFSSGREMLVCC